MKSKSIILYIFILLVFFKSEDSNAQKNKEEYSIYLIGDCGKNNFTGTNLLNLKKEITANPNSTVLFLGDNIYPSGLHFEDKNSILKINAQLAIVENYQGKAFFIPGNHDWAAQKKSGYQTILNQQKYIDTFLLNHSLLKNKNSGIFFPKDALPGPSSFLISEKLRLIIIDTQWFLHAFKKGKKLSSKETEKQFYHELDSLLTLSDKNNEHVIIAGHHPLLTNGKHAKPKALARFIVNYIPPFQLIGLAGIYRLLSQDIDHHKYKKMRSNLIAIFNKHNNVHYVSGHEHNIQLFKENNVNYIVSGSGSKVSALRTKKRFIPSYENDKQQGFIQLKLSKDNTFTTILVDETGNAIQIMNY